MAGIMDWLRGSTTQLGAFSQDANGNLIIPQTALAGMGVQASPTAGLAAGATPTMDLSKAAPGLFSNADGSFNWQGVGNVMQGVGALGGLWGGIQQNKIAKQQLALSREAYDTNMNNSIKTYNTALEDRIRSRYAMEGRSGEADAYLEKNRLSRS